MRYLGTLDDKAIEYPFGSAQVSLELTNKQLFNHVLFDTDGTGDLLVEGGFLIASEEAMTLAPEDSVMISAIEAGLVKVAARIHSFDEYLEDRRRVRHKVPPKDSRSTAYFNRLQQACDSSSAFLEYSLSGTDALTFAALLALSMEKTSQDLLAQIGPDVADRFPQFFEQTYISGNQGKPWTARAAWEGILRQLNAPENIRHALMILANRERQIIRGAAFAVQNGLEITVDTGFAAAPHPLAERVPFVSGNWSFNLAKGLPKVPYKLVMKNRRKLFEQLGPGSNSRLTKLRAEFIARRDELLRKGDAGQRQENYDLAGEDYEREIWRVIGQEPPSDWKLVNVAVGGLAGLVVDRGLVEPCQRICPFLRETSRRHLLTRGTAYLFTVGAMLSENVLGEAVEDEISQRYADLTDGTDDVYRTIVSKRVNSHQQLSINIDAAHNYFAGLSQ